MGDLPADGEFWDLVQLAQATRLCDWMFDQVPPVEGRTVAEVGAGIGTFTGRLLTAGAERVLAMEPEAPCADELERRLGADPRLEVSRDTLPQAPSLAALEGACDVILCQNVLEHIEDDFATVADLAAALSPSGTLVLLVPAHPRLFGSLDRQYGHYRRYDRRRLGAVCAGAGLETAALYSFNALGIAGWCVKNARSSSSLDQRSLRAYEALVRAWRPVEDRVRLPWGLSLVVHARRSTGARVR